MANSTDTFILRDILEPLVDKAFSNPSNVRALIRGIQKYADRWSSILLSADFSHKLLITDKDKGLLNDVTGIPDATVKETIKKVPFIEPSWNDANNTFYQLSIVIARWFKKNKMENEKIATLVFMTYALYSSSHYNSFKYLPKKEVMEYTINNLSNRFLIKRVGGTIQGCIEHTVRVAFDGKSNLAKVDETSDEEVGAGKLNAPLLHGSDSDACAIIDAIHTRMRSFVVNIAREFYENNKTGAYLNTNKEDISEDNYFVSDSMTLKISRLASIVTNSIVTEGFDYNNCIKRSVRMNSGVSEKKLIAMLDTIIETDTEGINLIISNIITLFVYKGTGNRIEDVGSMKFLSEAMQIYKSNAQDDVTNSIKSKLLEWIDATSKKYGRNFISRGKTSLDTYRRAIYTVFVFKIMSASKK